jgi:hypothetical protein
MFVNAIALAFSLGGLQSGRGMLGKALLNIQLMSSYLILNIRVWFLQKWLIDPDQLIIF